MQIVLFDCFGVLSSPVYYLIIKKIIPTPLQEEYIQLLDQLDLGLLSEEKLIEMMAEASNEDRISIWNMVQGEPVLNYDLLDYIEENLYQNIRLGLLTNIPKSLLDRVLGGHLGMFDSKYISSEIGLVKPNKEIFEYVIKDLDIPASEIVFFDDSQKNIDVAIEVGLDGILYTSVEQVQREMARYL
jgi:HAD superfamily hydrolase (TIGR01549 family)